MILRLGLEHRASICNHAESTYPEECCGIVLGKRGNQSKKAIEVWATQNVWSPETAEDYAEKQVVATKARRYAIAPLDLLKAQKEARSRELDIIGFYHSHPDYPAMPSEFDRNCAWQEYSYIIVSVQQGRAKELKSWYLDSANQFQPEEIQAID